MADDRHDSRRGPREQTRYPDERFRDREAANRYPEGRYPEGRDRQGRDREDRDREDRGFFERAGDEIASWFGDDEAERRRRDERLGGRDDDYGRGFDRDDDRGNRPVTGDYGRSEGRFAASGFGRGDEARGPDRASNWGRDENRRTGLAGNRTRHDPHYQQWRQRQIDELDRDYDEYRSENQSRFENDFGSWRSSRLTKRQMLGQIREHMEVVGSDDEHVGTVDRVVRDRIILAKSDPESGGAHHSLTCTDIGRVEGEKVILDCTAEQARNRWRDESRERALFEREDQGEAGPHALDRSFSGTYR